MPLETTGSAAAVMAHECSGSALKTFELLEIPKKLDPQEAAAEVDWLSPRMQLALMAAAARLVVVVAAAVEEEEAVGAC